MSIIPDTAPALIRRVAAIIEPQHADRAWWLDEMWPSKPEPDSHMSIFDAATRAITGEDRTLQTIADLDAEHLAELLDHIEFDLGCPIAAWERIHAADSPSSVARRLCMAALRFELALANAPRHAAEEAPCPRRYATRSL